MKSTMTRMLDSAIGIRMRPIRRLADWLLDDRGQDLVEYALLGTFIGLVGFAAINFLTNSMSTAYSNWSVEVDNPTLTDMPDPAGS